MSADEHVVRPDELPPEPNSVAFQAAADAIFSGAFDDLTVRELRDRLKVALLPVYLTHDEVGLLIDALDANDPLAVPLLDRLQRLYGLTP